MIKNKILYTNKNKFRKQNKTENNLNNIGNIFLCTCVACCLLHLAVPIIITKTHNSFNESSDCLCLQCGTAYIALT